MNILDPATGTGTFITNLINHLPVDRLEYKYLNEIYANEVEILPYYIANLNIEYTYKERTGRYLEFPSLCFVDTLDNMDWKGASGAVVPRQTALMNLGGLSEENWIRVQEQNAKPISVIIGNPPYNANAKSWGDDSANKGYFEIDSRIRDTYVASSSAQKTKQYDMYKRFIRWASDRLVDDGIVALITNRAYLDALQDDGFRKVLPREFSDLYIVDLGGNFQRGGRSGNIFGIRIGVAIGFFVRKSGMTDACNINYLAIVDDQTRSEKLSTLTHLDLADIAFESVVPDNKGNWFNKASEDFERLPAIVGRQSKSAKNTSNYEALFHLHSLGTSTNRDEWVYDFDVQNLRDKVLFFSDAFTDLADRGDQSYPTTIKWSSTLRDRFDRGARIVYNDGRRIESLYRPFTVKQYFADPMMSDRLTKNHFEMFGADLRQPNAVICLNGPGSNNFAALGANKLVEKKYCDTNNAATFCLPLYRYAADGVRVSNITQWGLRQFHEHYGDDDISSEDVFAYVYAMLHDPAYRERYEIDLRREFPRVYFQDDFDWWAQQGRELLDLHLEFETAESWPLERNEKDGVTPTRAILRADKERGVITLDEQTTLAGIPAAAWEYRLGSRSALEWVLDQYKERKPRDPTIRERFNTYRFADHKERVVALIGRVCTVSTFTTGIVNELGARSTIELD